MLPLRRGLRVKWEEVGGGQQKGKEEELKLVYKIKKENLIFNINVYHLDYKHR